MTQAIENGYENATAKDLVGLVREDYMNDIKELFGQADEDTLLSMLGDGLTEKTVKAHMSKVKSKQKTTGEKTTGEKPKPQLRPQPQKYMTKDEWRARIADRKGYRANGT